MSGAVVSIQERAARSRLGLWLFFVTEVFTFSTFLVLRFSLWGNTRPELDQNIGLVATAVLLISSWSMNRGELAIKYGDKRTFTTSLIITALLGIVFLAGIVVFEWGAVFGLSTGHYLPTDGVYGSVLFLMTGMHALHVLIGIIFIIKTLIDGNNGKFTPESHFGVEATALFWHFVDLVWVFFYPALYLIGTVHH
ncbi:MAG TPA: cytochrome c oxidase subunit 3 [Anaerolineales bacterium]|nr:cytochrome c oxidase subunit 3 [Anaerolineales bacterium]